MSNPNFDRCAVCRTPFNMPSDPREECPVAEEHAKMPTVPGGFCITVAGNLGYSIGTMLPSGRGVSVDVQVPHIAYNGEQPASVNWPGIGSVSAHDAARFAELINVASRLARRLDTEAAA